MNDHPVISGKDVRPLLDTPYIRVFDLEYEPGRHYYDATRRTADQLVAVQTDEAFRSLVPDAVSCFVILAVSGQEPKLLFNREYRYPVGQYLLSVPAGLIDPEDRCAAQPALTAAAREIQEETGLTIGPEDQLTLVNPLVFSTPGMTDESNALACAVLHPVDLSALTQAGCVGTEKFDGFTLVSLDEARRLLRQGRDDEGIFYSVYTWAALIWFVSGLWKDPD